MTFSQTQTPRSKIIALYASKMSAPMEVLVTADSAGQLWNCAIFDSHTGTNLLSYRGGNSSARSLTILNGEYILGAQLGKNFINVWEIQRKVSERGYSRITNTSVLRTQVHLMENQISGFAHLYKCTMYLK